jgi:hypothetical protein
MARARVKRSRQQTEIAEVIIAEWFRILPETLGDPRAAYDVNSLKAAFSDIIEQQCRVEFDAPDQIVIVVPQPPAPTKSLLRDYLTRNEDFLQGMSAAVLFGCGR